MRTIFAVNNMSVEAYNKLIYAGFEFTCNYDEADIIWTGLTPIQTDKIVACPCTGVDHIKAPRIIYLDEKFKRTDGLLVTSTAEHTFSLMLQLAKKARIQLKDKVLGIIGYGRIGRQVAKYAKAFGMEVIAIDKGYAQEQFNNLLKESDIISIHVPLKEDTINMIGENAIKMMKFGALIVNTSRSTIVDKNVFKNVYYADDFLNDGIVEGAIQTPHIAGNSIEAREITDNYIAEILIKELMP